MINSVNQVLPSSFARKESLGSSDALTANQLIDALEEFLAEITKELKRRGCRLIGHIKGLVDAQDNGHLFFSITSFDEGVRFKSELIDGITNVTLTTNIIVYGIEEALIQDIYNLAFEKIVNQIKPVI